jgi:hypothetical protein
LQGESYLRPIHALVSEVAWIVCYSRRIRTTGDTSDDICDASQGRTLGGSEGR